MSGTSDIIAAGGTKKPYIPHPGLVDAVEVAVELGLPLLLTGEPGTGKTECANWVATKYDIKNVFKFVAKSTSVATDLFYVYDSLGRFSSSQIAQHLENERERAANPKNFIEYAAMGKAILSAHKKAKVSKFISPNESGFKHAGKATRSIVLIDEIDKAPRDFPNDLLDEISNHQFRVRELGDLITPEIEAPELLPIIVITSNSERQLPGPFLRRCAYFDIPFPKRRDESRDQDEDESYFIEDIVAARLNRDMADSKLGKDVLKYFYHLRENQRPALSRKPATAELLNWMEAMQSRIGDTKGTLADQRESAIRTISVLLKNRQDQALGKKMLESWGSSPEQG